MRVALIRGALQRLWELPNYEFGPGHSVDLFVSRGLDLGGRPDYFGLRRFPSPSDLKARLGPRVGGAIDLTLGPLEFLYGLEEALKGYDIAHTLELDTPLTSQAVGARRAGGCARVVATVMENIPFKQFPNRRVAERAHEMASAVDHFLAITERARLHLETAGVPADRISVLPLGIDMERFSPAPARRPGPLRIVSVARLEPAKGVEDLVIAVGLLRQRGVGAELTLVGSGPLAGRLSAVARELGVGASVHVRSIPWPQVPDAYREADVFVLASAPTRNWREQFGFAVVEAMASGLPAIVGASGSLMEVVGRDDVLVAPHDPLSLADQLERLAGDEPARMELGAFNRRRALEHFDRETISARLLEVYGRALERPARN